MTAWAHLPNVGHIDRVLAHLKAHPERWSVAMSTANGQGWILARSPAWDATRVASRDIVMNALWDVSRHAVRNASGATNLAGFRINALDVSRSALLALVAYDDCAHYLNLPSGAVRVAASVDIPAATLLLPAVIAMEQKS